MTVCDVCGVIVNIQVTSVEVNPGWVESLQCNDTSAEKNKNSVI